MRGYRRRQLKSLAMLPGAGGAADRSEMQTLQPGCAAAESIRCEILHQEGR